MDYMKKMCMHKLLTPEQELELGRKIQAGKEAEFRLEDGDSLEDMMLVEIGATAKKELIECNMRLVMKAVSHYTKYGVDLDDLFGEGCIGLMTAADKYDPGMNNRFSTCAFHWIRQAVVRAVENQAKTIRIPSHAQAKIRKVMKAEEAFLNAFGHMPSNEELSKYMGQSEESIKSIASLSVSMTSLDKSISEDGETVFADMIEDPNAQIPENVCIDKARIDAVNKVLSQLNEREENIIRKHMGIGEEEPMTLEQLGAEYGISRERVRQIENAGFKKILRNPFSKAQLEAFRS